MIDGLLSLAGAHEITLIERDDERGTSLGGESGDLCVLFSCALMGVDHQDGDIGAIERADRLIHTKRLDAASFADVRLTPDARRIDKDIAAIITLEEGIDAIDRRARAIIDELPLFAEEPVDHRALPRVGPADDGNARDRIIELFGGREIVREDLGDSVFKLSKSAAVQRRDRDELIHTERIMIERVMRSAIGVALIRDVDHGFIGLAEELYRFMIGRRKRRRSIKHEDDPVAFIERE